MTATLANVSVDLVDPSPYQKRRRFESEQLQRLADDLQLNGLLNPVLCRPVNGRYELVHGERRLRAARLIPWDTITAQVRVLTDLEARRICAAENVHRVDLTPIELIEATAEWVDSQLMGIEGYREFGETSLQRVSNLLRTLNNEYRIGNSSHPMVGTVIKAFKDTNRDIAWRSFYEKALRPYLKLDEDVKEVAIKHNLAKSKAPELQKLKEAAPKVFEEIKKTGQVDLGIFTEDKYDIEDVSARELKSKTQAITSPHAHVSFNAGENEWYTPAEIIEAARNVMGSIDLDPASTSQANTVVKATTYYTARNDGLSKDWQGRVWMNPPYKLELIEAFVAKLVKHVRAGDVPGAVVLVNNATETTWFLELANVASAACFPRGRVRFWAPDGKIAAPLQGQAIIYIGTNTSVFLAEFGRFGWVATVDSTNN